MSRYAAHYSTLHDDALIELALRDELLDEAKADLHAELKRRGITDLAAARAVRDGEATAEEDFRQRTLATRSRVIVWRTRMIYFFAAASIAYGVYRLVNPNAANPGDDGGIMILLGIGLLLFAVVSSAASRFLNARVLHRKPSRS